MSATHARMTEMNEAESTAALTAPAKWPWALQSPPTLSSEQTTWRGALLRSWIGTSPVMVQPPLDHHYIVRHLGGAKNVTRRRDGPMSSSIAEDGSITIVPAGTSYVWQTHGPIAFAHLYVPPRQLENVIDEQFGGEGRDATLIDRIGCRDHLLEPLFATMMDELARTAQPSRLLLDSLLEGVVIRLAERHARAALGVPGRAVALAPHRLRRVLDFMEAHLGEDIALADLVAAAGTSQFHFSRAFRAATGLSPYRYLLRRRLDYARALLLTTCESLQTISTKCGFNSRHQFSLMFKRAAGIGPKRFRTLRCSAPFVGG